MKLPIQVAFLTSWKNWPLGQQKITKAETTYCKNLKSMEVSAIANLQGTALSTQLQLKVMPWTLL